MKMKMKKKQKNLKLGNNNFFKLNLIKDQMMNPMNSQMKKIKMIYYVTIYLYQTLKCTKMMMSKETVLFLVTMSTL